MARKRKAPLRKCIVTGEMKKKHDLIRVVRNKSGDIFVDPTGKQNGRGAYLTVDLDIIQKAKETKVLEKVFQRAIDAEIYDELESVAKELIEDE